MGDALGAAVEFCSLEQIHRDYGPGGIAYYDLAFGRRGAITDDTQMTLFVADGLIRARIAARKGASDPLHELQLTHQRWLHTQGTPWDAAAGDLAPAPDGWLVEQRALFSARAPGRTCFEALRAFGAGSGRGTPERPVNDSKGCGGVMRVAPVALWSSDDREVFRLAAEVAALTHGHPSGYLSAGAFAVTVRQVLDGAELPAAVTAARAELARWDGHEETTAALDAAVEPVADLESLGGGWTGESALAIAVAAALAATGFDDGVRRAVNHGGDSDHTGALCGQLLGARLGAYAIPRHWVHDLELADVPTQLACGWGGCSGVSLVFLASALPTVAATMTMGGVGIGRVAPTLLVVAVELGVVCALAQCLSAVLVRTVTSAVLSYVVVFALSIGTLIAVGLALASTTHEVERTFDIGRETDENGNPVGEPRTETYTSSEQRPEKVWWLPAPNPFVILADAAPIAQPRFDPRTGYEIDSPLDPLGEIAKDVRNLRDRDREFGRTYIDFPSASPLQRADEARDKPGAVWPYGLAFDAALGLGAVAITIRRLRTPADKLARGVRVA